jgi:hypothetical protein
MRKFMIVLVLMLAVFTFVGALDEPSSEAALASSPSTQLH